MVMINITGNASESLTPSIPGFGGNILGGACGRSTLLRGGNYDSFSIRFAVSEKFIKEKLADVRENADLKGFEVNVTAYSAGKTLELFRNYVPKNESSKVLESIIALGDAIQNEINIFGVELKTESIQK